MCRAAPAWICCPPPVARLARNPQIVALKEATGSLARARETLSVCPPEFALLAGDDATAVDLMSVGARGVISVSANVAPRRMHEAFEAALAGDLAKARAIDATLQPLHKDLFVEASPIPVKWAVARMGPHRERNSSPVGRIVAGASRYRAARDAGRRNHP